MNLRKLLNETSNLDLLESKVEILKRELNNLLINALLIDSILSADQYIDIQHKDVPGLPLLKNTIGAKETNTNSFIDIKAIKKLISTPNIDLNMKNFITSIHYPDGINDSSKFDNFILSLGFLIESDDIILPYNVINTSSKVKDIINSINKFNTKF
jgi:hypothetical protein